MSDYYPEFYLRRRQREHSQRRAAIVTIGVVVLFVAGALVTWLLSSFMPRSTQAGASPELAEQQQELKTQQLMASAAVPTELTDEDAPQSVDLKNVPYGESMPLVSVGLAGATAQAAELPGQAELPPAEPELDPAGLLAAATQPPAEPAVADPRVERVSPAEPRPEPKVEPKPEPRNAETARSAEKPKAEPRTETRAESPAPKKEPANTEPEAVTKPASKEPSYSYIVYAGAYLSREEAEKGKSNLSALGLSGSIIDAKTGDYLLRVHTLDDMEQATALKSKLAGSGFGEAIVTRKAK